MTEKKFIKKLKKFIKKEWSVDILEIKMTDNILMLSERIVMKSNNCNLEEAYKKWILREDMHLVGWIAFVIVNEFTQNNRITINHTIKDIYNAIY